MNLQGIKRIRAIHKQTTSADNAPTCPNGVNAVKNHHRNDPNR
jgi:hypothetical protein